MAHRRSRKKSDPCDRLLGYRFSPRLADLGDARLWRIDRKANYGSLNSLSKGAINLALIRNSWADLIRLAGSLKLGHLKRRGPCGHFR